MLTSRSARVGAATALRRRTERADRRLFLAEGPQAVREALAVPDCVREVFALPGAHAELRSPTVPWRDADERALAALSETVTPQGIVAVCAFLDVPLGDLLHHTPRLLAVCVDVRDPGNAGSVIRCADAAGAGGVALVGTSVDPYNGKAVRASAGSLFHLPVVVEPDTAAAVESLRRAGLTTLAATGSGDLDLDDAIDSGLLATSTAWLFGNEAHGLAAAVADVADHRVRIPIHGRAESLNLATAAAVCLYASARAQRGHPARRGSR